MSEFSQQMPTTSNASYFSDNKNTIIIVLLIIIILAFIGFNVLIYSGQILEEISKVLGPTFKNLLSMIGFSTGTLIKNASDVAAGGANLGVDIAKGTSHSVGDLLISASKGGMDESQKRSLEQALKPRACEQSDKKSSEPSPTPTTDPIVSQNLKSNWCFVGDFNGTRGCVELGKNTCASGQVFTSQSACLNPDDEDYM
jgi:hypothetical protein